MLKKLRKRLKQKRLAAALALVVALSLPASPVCADVGKQSFNDGHAHTIGDNITVTDDNGLEVINTGTSATMTGKKITVTGATGGTGAIASSLGKITLCDVTISSTGGGIATVSGPPFGFSGEITMSGGSITATGTNAFGASASNNGKITLTNVAVNTTGDGSYGVVSQFAWLGTNFSMTGGSITTSGSDSYGAFSGATGSIGLTNVAVKSSGARSYGLYVLNADSKVTMNGGSITTSGADAHAVYVDDSGAVTLTNVAVNATGTGSVALFTSGYGSINATVNGQSMSGAGGLMSAVTGTINLTAYGASRLAGIAVAGVGGTANLTLNDSSSWTSSAESNLTNLTLNGGTVVQSRGAAGPIKLTIKSNLGGTGGTFRTNANINDISQSDLIVVQGLASGSHRVEAALVGGYPADLYKVVRLVDVNNALANTAAFGGGSDVRAYRYGVAKGTALPAAYSGVLGGHEADYYLYNTFSPSTPANAAIGTTMANSTVWYAEVNEIRKRLGDLRAGPAGGDGFWARTYASEYRVKPGAGQDFDQRLVGIEAGMDTPRRYAGGTRHTGWVAGAGWAHRTFDLGGHGDTNSMYAGGYASWVKDDGAYWDIVAKQNWFRHRFETPVLGGGTDSAVYGTTGLGLSVETGRRFERKDGTFFEPQAELAALWTKGRNYMTAGGLAVNARAETSLQLRLGAVFGRKTATPGNGTRQVYGKLAWVQELAGENRTTVDGVAFASSLKGGGMVAGAGLTVDTAKSQLYLDVETSWGKKTDKPWGINLGCRWKF